MAMDEDVREAVRAHGIRNALVTSIAPTGTISLYAGNVSSGIEPVFAYSYTRKVLQKDGTRTEEEIADYAVTLYREMYGADAELPEYFVNAQTLAPLEHVRMQAAAQKWVDSSISKTINCPEDISFEDFKDVYLEAFETGCKGCTTYRPNAVTGSVLSVSEETPKEKFGSFNAALNWHMKQTGKKTAEIANAAGVSLDVVKKLVHRDGSSTSAENAVAIASVFGRDLSAFMHAAAAPDVVATDAAEPRQPHGDVVYMSEPLDRPQALEGNTYKLKWPDSEHAIYLTINDIIVGGHRRPFEVFINSKNMEHFAWTVALTRMISAVFRRGGDVSFVVEELKAVFDPRGGAWVQGKYIPSILAAIGGVIERHMIATGFLEGEGMGLKSDPQAQVVNLEQPRGPACPNCGQFDLRMVEGCMTCGSCGHSKCS